jgi:hypothetical protein
MDAVLVVALPEWFAYALGAAWPDKQRDLTRVIEEWAMFPRPVDAAIEDAEFLLRDADWIPAAKTSVSASVLRLVRQATDDPRLVRAIEGSQSCHGLAEPRPNNPVKGLRPRAMPIVLGLAAISGINQAIGTATPPAAFTTLGKALRERRALLASSPPIS